MSVRDVINRLRVELAALESEAAALDAKADCFHAVIAHFESTDADREPAPPAKALRNAAWELLREHGEPMHYRDMYKLLKARGVVVHGKEPVRNVGAHMSADERFTPTGDGHWGLASWGTNGRGR